jgi:hypothetical protein
MHSRMVRRSEVQDLNSTRNAGILNVKNIWWNLRIVKYQNQPEHGFVATLDFFICYFFLSKLQLCEPRCRPSDK